MSENTVKWHPYPKEMPDMAGGEKYIVTVKYKRNVKTKTSGKRRKRMFYTTFIRENYRLGGAA